MNILLKLAFNASKLEHAFSTLSAGLAIFYLVIVFVSLKCDLLFSPRIITMVFGVGKCFRIFGNVKWGNVLGFSGMLKNFHIWL